MRRKRLPRNWDRLRRRVLREQPACQDGTVCNGLGISTEVDHVQPGDNHSLSNLQGICPDCHKRKTQLEAAQARGASS